MELCHFQCCLIKSFFFQNRPSPGMVFTQGSNKKVTKVVSLSNKTPKVNVPYRMGISVEDNFIPPPKVVGHIGVSANPVGIGVPLLVPWYL